MVECVCPKCKAKLRIDENDAIPGCREFTSGVPTVTVEEK